MLDELMQAGIVTPETIKQLEENAQRGLAEEAEQERKLAEREERLALREQTRAEREENRAKHKSRHEKQKDRDAADFDPLARIDWCTKSNRPLVIEMRNVKAVGISWLWPNRIPRGKLTLFSGDSGLGKSYVALDIAARVTNGSDWPGGEDGSVEVGERSGKEGGEKENTESNASDSALASVDSALCNHHSAIPTGGVLILSDDDQPEDTLMPRLEALGANVERVRFMEGVERNDQKENFALPRDTDMLERAIMDMPNCKLVIIDPLASFLSTMGSGSLAKVRAALNPLKDVAKRHNVAIILINHLNKSAGSPLHRSAGSVSIMGIARTAWAFARCKHDPTRCIMVPLKNNIGPATEALSYTINAHGLEWDDEPFELSAADAFGSQEKVRGRNPHAVKEAMVWLEYQLSSNKKDGLAQTWLEKEAAEAGINIGTLRRAKKKLGVEAKQFEKTWLWCLPTIPKPVQTSNVELTTQ
jgi:hypothetical protein